MKKINLDVMPDVNIATFASALPAHVPEQEDAKDLASEQFLYSLSKLTEFKLALSRSQQQLKAAQQQIDTLEKINSCLRQKLNRLEKKCAQALHSSYHDELTGLPNRNLLLDRLKQAMALSDRQHKQLALLFIDLDKFKNVNDRLGHVAGDKLLQQVAGRLSDCIRSCDTACRYGGDEFVIMLPEIEGQESLTSIIDKIRAHLAAPYVVDGNVMTVTASIGTAIYRSSGQKFNDFIKQADIAMYHAKAHSARHLIS
jgi:diguanylate cyclase (GGDEF)-like protein